MDDPFADRLYLGALYAKNIEANPLAGLRVERIGEPVNYDLHVVRGAFDDGNAELGVTMTRELT